MSEKLESYNIFPIPVGDFFDNDPEACYLVYAPLKNQFFLATSRQVEYLEKQIKQREIGDLLQNLMDAESLPTHEISTDTFCTLHLLLNEKCNFHCTYCYSAAGRSSVELTMNEVKPLLDFFLSGKRKAVRERTVMFMGGGEPMLSWPLLKQSTLYAKHVAAKENVTIHFSLTTNGSLMNDDELLFLKEHDFTVQISFEILPEVQRVQRGPYIQVAKNLQHLTEKGIKNYVRSTITAENVDRIPEMVDYCHKHFPLVCKMSCQQVVDPAYFTSTAIVDNFFQRYFLSYQKGTRRAELYGITLHSSSSHLLNYSHRDRFCYNLLCLTPYGTLTLCPDVSSPDEPDYQESVIGELKDNKVLFHQEAFERLTSGNIYTIEKCKTCYARWNCGGGCPSSRRVYSTDIFDAICNHYRRMLRNSLIEELARKHKMATGNDFYTDIASKL
ncbi:MAG: radical SAM protein [Prevotella sp.]|nr:radical SAM protein [Prevotella sp.]MBQ6209996.1 radical SAM protein [Prevotella sp.]